MPALKQADRPAQTLAIAFGLLAAYVEQAGLFSDHLAVAMGAIVLLGAVLLGVLWPRDPWQWAALIALWPPVAILVRGALGGTLADDITRALGDGVYLLAVSGVGALFGAALGRGLARRRG